MKPSKEIFALSIVLLSSFYQLSSAYGQNHKKAGTNGAQMLELRRGARPTAMGGAFVAVVDDANAILYNPAGLGYLTKKEAQFNQNKYFDEFITQDAHIVYPLSQMQAKDIQNFGALAGGISFVDYGTLAGRNALNQDTGEFSAEDRIISLAYGKALSKTFAFGVTGRQLREEIQGLKARGYSFDAGLLFHEWTENVSVGLTVRNFGGNFVVDRDENPLPTMYTLGGSSNFFNRRLLVTADFSKPVHNFYFWSFGSELWLTRILALRLGYDTRTKVENNISAGVGIVLHEFEFSFLPFAELGLNYAFSSEGELGDNHQLEMIVKIGVE